MSTATLEFDSTTSADEALQYRAVHTGAIIGAVLAAVTSVFTAIAFASSPEACIYVSLLNAIPMSMCLWSLARIRRDPDQYTGRGIATIGLLSSMFFLTVGLGHGAYVYATEVPDGYARISFNGMKPDALEERGGVVVPPDVAALDGKKVFIKGYIRPDSVSISRGIKRFLLVRDNNQCCFGDLSKIKYYDQMVVDMVGSRTVDYSDGVFRMGGILKIEPENVYRGPAAPVFSLRADYAK